VSELLRVSDLELGYRTQEGIAKAVGPLSFQVFKGESLGLIGESGAGKSTLALEILGLLRYRGGIRLKGTIESTLRENEMAYIPQDPLASLNPLFSIGSHLREIEKDERKIRGVFERVRLSLTQISLKSYPHELSGGMRQRVLIAIALLSAPKLIVADEPTSSLDVTTQTEVVDLFREIKADGISFFFVTHQLPLAASFCDRVAVMQAGRIVEQGIPSAVFRNSQESYTQRLVQSVPVWDPVREKIF